MLITSGWQGDKRIKLLVVNNNNNNIIIIIIIIITIFIKGGEACRPLVAQLAYTCKNLYNVYGPTETTIWYYCFYFVLLILSYLIVIISNCLLIYIIKYLLFMH